MNASEQMRLTRWQRISGGAGIILLALCIVVGFANPARVFQAYWFAWVFWTGLALGGMSVLMMQYALRSAWGDAVQRPALAVSWTLPLMALLFIPSWLGLAHIFPWAHPDFAMRAWAHKRLYLNVPWFSIRTVGYFVVAMALLLTLRHHARQEARGDATATIRLRNAGCWGLVVYSALTLFAGTDWYMSLEPEWFSTMPVVILMAWQFLSALALCVMVAIAYSHGLHGEPLTVKQLHDLGNLLLAFVIFWTYVTFSQFLIIWAGDQPREISWYLHRKSGGWQYVAVALALLQFAFPFALLLSRAAKRHAKRLLPIAALVFASTVLNVFWLVTPAFEFDRLPFPWMEIAAFVGIGGLWFAAFLAYFKPPGAAPQMVPEVTAHA